MQRSSGVLLHPSSLPGAGPSGTLGAAARRFASRLADAEQTVWQMLPLTPPGPGGSPYMSPSAFALHPALLDADDLVADGLLAPEDVERALAQVPRDAGPAWEGLGEALAGAALARAGEASARLRADAAAFAQANAHWLPDYARYRVARGLHEDAAMHAWEPPLRDRDPDALARLDLDHAPALERTFALQLLLHRQVLALRTHCDHVGVELLGDLPIFVAPDSADVWQHRSLFQLDATLQPQFVAGVPPDYFSETGQLWGNPLYDWEASAATGHAWWIARIERALACAHHVRIDHFRAFAAYWRIPAGDEDARGGTWQPGPGASFFDTVASALGELPLVAEDLGTITPDVDALRRGLSLPGMRVLHFALGGDFANPHRPDQISEDMVVYTGTHDNDTTVGWWSGLEEAERREARELLGVRGEIPSWELLECAWNTRAVLAIAPMQDLLSLGTEDRMNTPGTTDGNWGWRMHPDALEGDWTERLRAATRASGRSGG